MIGLLVGHAIMDFILFSVFDAFKNYLANLGFSSIQTTDLKVIIGIGSLVGIGLFTGILLNTLNNYLKHKKERTLEIEKPLSMDNQTQSQQTISVTKKLGNPSIAEIIQQYENRDTLPKFKELIASATETVDMSGLSFTLMILQHSDVIEKALKKGRKFTFLILDADSKEVKKYSQTLENGNI